MNNEERIVLNTIEEFRNFNIDNYKAYCLVPVDPSDLVNDGKIRDTICQVLKGKEMTKEDLIHQVSDYIDVPKNRISKVITKMKKEGSIFILDYLDYMGNKIFGTW